MVLNYQAFNFNFWLMTYEYFSPEYVETKSEKFSKF